MTAVENQRRAEEEAEDRSTTRSSSYCYKTAVHNIIHKRNVFSFYVSSTHLSCASFFFPASPRTENRPLVALFSPTMTLLFV